MEGEAAYVKLAFRGVFEAEVISAGESYELRLLHKEERVTAPSSAVWSAGYTIEPKT